MIPLDLSFLLIMQVSEHCHSYPRLNYTRAVTAFHAYGSCRRKVRLFSIERGQEEWELVVRQKQGANAYLRPC